MIKVPLAGPGSGRFFFFFSFFLLFPFFFVFERNHEKGGAYWIFGRFSMLSWPNLAARIGLEAVSIKVNSRQRRVNLPSCNFCDDRRTETMSQDPLSVSDKLGVAKEKKDAGDQSFKAGEYKAGTPTVMVNFSAIDENIILTRRHAAALQSYHQVNADASALVVASACSTIDLTLRDF